MGTRIAAAFIMLTAGSLSWAIYAAPVEPVPAPLAKRARVARQVTDPRVGAASDGRPAAPATVGSTPAKDTAASLVAAAGTAAAAAAAAADSPDDATAGGDDGAAPDPFGTPALIEAKDAFAHKRYATARALLYKAGLADPPARFLAALSAFRDKQWEVAASEFEALAPDYPVLAELCLTYAGRARLETRAFAAAASVLEQVPPKSPHFKDARIALARAQVGLDQPRKALATLEPFIDGEVTQDASARAWFLDWASEIAEKAGDGKSARKLQLELWSRHPTTSYARQVGKTLPSRAISSAARAARADALADSHRHAEARKEAARVARAHPLPHAAGCHARFVQGKILRKERRHPEAIALLEPVARRCRDPELRVRTLYVLGSSQSIVAPESGRKTYERLSREFPEHSFADDALYYAADLDVQLGDAQKALTRLQIITTGHPTSDFAAEAAFRGFWHHWRAGDLAQAEAAAAAFETLTRADGLEPQRARARYWQARVLEKQSRTDEAQALYEAVLREHPATVYARWAQQRGAQGKGPAATSMKPSLGEMASDPRYLAATELTKLGLPEGDGLFLSIDFAAYPAEATVALFHALQQAGLHAVAAQLPESRLSAVLYGPLDEASRAVWKVHRPDTFKELLERSATAAGVPPDLFRALVRRESRFVPTARSGAGAIGLAQLMPVTARATARSLGLKLRSPAQLTHASLNARLGATYLSQLLRRFDVPELAVAAYNGGPTRVERWWSERQSDELDEFVENIPIAETRGYVKNVLGDFAAYERLDSEHVVASHTEQLGSEG